MSSVDKKKLKIVFWILFVLCFLFLVFLLLNKKPTDQDEKESLKIKNKEIKNEDMKMTIRSSAFKEGEIIPVKFTCDGENISPPLEMQDIPANTKSLALIIDDPDAPVGTWVHWTAWNINPKASSINEGSVPAGATEGITSFGNPGYGGPCPPSGTHRYFFKVFALDTELDIPSSSNINDLESALGGHILGSGELMGVYSRK